jgi:hypothetical protein
VKLALLAAGLIATLTMVAPAAEAKPKGKRSVPVTVMTRNLFLGADLGPGLSAGSFPEFITANGAILREVDATNFPVRSQGLAAEILKQKPHLVGLQEVALWRTGPFNADAALNNAPVATDVKQDFLQILLDQLNAKTNKKFKGYEPAVVQEEFDFEAPADYDDNPGTGVFGGEINGRLTMRDVILVRKGSGVKVNGTASGHFKNLFTPTVGGPGGVSVPVTRGWTAADVTVKAPSKGKGDKKGQKKVKKSFRFVNTHFEAFDDETQVPSIRALQATELTADSDSPYGEGPASANKVILAGDLNSNVPGVKPGDEQAYQVMLDAGFTERSTSDPLSCCVNSVISGDPAQFDHQVDHIMTNQSNKKVKLVKSVVTGLEPVNGFFDSDHAGITSKLIVR